MTIKTIDQFIDWAKIGTSDGVEFAIDDVVVHKDFDHGTIYANFIKVYPGLILIPIAPGTELYTQVGPNTSYIKALELPEPTP